jgi:hypothetical protein
LRYALTLKGRNTIYNPYPARSIYPNRKTREKDQKAQRARGTSLSRSQGMFFLIRKKNKY